MMKSMKSLEKRIEILEGKVKVLTCMVILFGLLFGLSLMVGPTSLATQAGAAASAPKVVEAEAFILKDREGNIRGMWSAEDLTTTFAVAYKEQYPSIVLSVSEKAATMNIRDRLQNQVAIGVNDQRRSLIVGNKNWKTLIGMTATNTKAELEVSSQAFRQVITTEPKKSGAK